MVVRLHRPSYTLVVLAIMAMPQVGWGQTASSTLSATGRVARHTDDTDTSARQEAERRPLYPIDIGVPDPMAARLCETLHTLPQTLKAQCCGTPPSSSLTGECVRTLTSAVRGGAVKLVAAEIDRCVEATARQLQGCDWVMPLTPPTPPACGNVVHGQLDSGARCRSSLECKDSLYCRGLGPTAPGICAEPVAVGTACGQGQDMLALYTRQALQESRHPDCVGVCQAGQCAAIAALDGPCTASKQCVAGAHCTAGRCVAGAAMTLGEACTSEDACKADLACVGGLCVALKAAGERCTSPFECQAACVKQPGAASGTCGKQCDALLAGSSYVPIHR